MDTSTLNKQNLWWKHGVAFATYDKHLRELRDAIVQFERKPLLFSANKIYIIRGPRQSGKTTWIKQTIENLLEQGKVKAEAILYLSCHTLTSNSKKELHRIIADFLAQTREFGRRYLFLDEITYVKEWAYELKNLADSGSFEQAAVIATGSNPAELKKESLPGRGTESNEFYLKPISFREFVLSVAPLIAKITPRRSGEVEWSEFLDSLSKLKNILEKVSMHIENIDAVKQTAYKVRAFTDELNFLFDIYLKTGGFPRAINSYLKNYKAKFDQGGKEKIDDEVYETQMRIISEDVFKAGRSEVLTKQILNAAIQKMSSASSYETIAKAGESLTHPTLIDYLAMFRDSFLLHILHAYDFSKKEARSKAKKKIYFADPFTFHAARAWLTGTQGYELTDEFLKGKASEQNAGALVEGIITTHLARSAEIPWRREQDTFLWFYYDQSKEIDFVFKDQNYIGLDAKYQHNVSFSDIKVIPQISQYVLLSKDTFEAKDNQIIVPVAVFLALLEQSEQNL